jgi:HTH-type transcriptional regulator/antitoxin HipB
MVPRYIKSARELGVVLRDVRREKGLTQAQLGELLGLTQTTVSNAERGTRNLQLKTILALFAALDLEFVAQQKVTPDVSAPWR